MKPAAWLISCSLTAAEAAVGRSFCLFHDLIAPRSKQCMGVLASPHPPAAPVGSRLAGVLLCEVMRSGISHSDFR